MPNVKARDADGNEVFYYSSQGNSAGSPAKSAENVETAINTTNAALGATADAAASSDTGSFSLLSFAKRLQQRLTTLLDRLPTLTVTSTRLLVDGSGVTQPVSGTVTANTGLSQPLTDTQLRASAILVTPALSSSGNTSAQTAATGTNWTAFSSQALKQLTISNQTGATLEFRQGGAGVGFQVPTANFYTFFGLTNANQLEVRRVDTSNTQVTVTARWES